MTTDAGDMAVAADPGQWPEPPLGRCWFAGCPNEVPQNPGGRAKTTCDQVVDGLRHSRLNKSLARRGELVVPAPGGGPAAGSTSGPVVPAAAVPVSDARRTLTTVTAQIQNTLAALPGLVERFEGAVAVMASQEAAALEIATVERGSRSAIDAAQAERDEAVLAARRAETLAQEQVAARERAEREAERALESEEAAVAARDQAETDRAALHAQVAEYRAQAEKTDRTLATVQAELTRTRERSDSLATELAAARTQIGQLSGELTAANLMAAAVTGERDRLAEELDTARAHAAAQQRRAEHAEDTARHAETTATQLRGELDTAQAGLVEQREQLTALHTEVAALTARHAEATRRVTDTERTLDQVRGELDATRRAGEARQAELSGELLAARTDLAGLTARLTAASEQLQAEKAHAADRIADQRGRAETAEQAAAQTRADLDRARADLDALRAQLADMRGRAETAEQAAAQARAEAAEPARVRKPHATQ